MSQRFSIKTLGCKANSYDGFLLDRELRRRGWSPASSKEGADLLIINSCTVTNEADRQSRKMAARLARQNPDASVVMTGCGAEVSPSKMAEARGVHFVVGNQDKSQLIDLVLKEIGAETDLPGARLLGTVADYDKLKAKHPIDRDWPLPEASFLSPDGQGERTRVFLKIQEGCDAFCTFCIIPYARGPARSLNVDTVISHVHRLNEVGVREIVLTGTDLGDYGKDFDAPKTLEDLIEAILERTTMERIRVSSLDPVEITPRFMALIEHEPRICAHVHVSLQSPHTEILRRMKRKYTADDVQQRLTELHDLGNRMAQTRGLMGGLFVGMDVISGFPGEDEKIFEWTYNQLSNLPWHRLHCFPYSERSGTAATRLSGVVPKKARKERVRALMRLSTERLTGHAQSLVDSEEILEVLGEGSVRGPDEAPNWAAGTTQNYYRVLFQHTEAPSLGNRLIRVLPTAVHVDERAGDVAIIGSLASGVRQKGVA
jgi:threonylcarbamoyladenosine tRNA methylthiotransferase MtaB